MSPKVCVTIDELADIATRDVTDDFERIDVELVDGEFVQRRARAARTARKFRSG